MSRVNVFTLIDRSVKNMGAVDPKVKALAIELIKRAYHEGINVQITSGFRSYTEQAALYGQGRKSYIYNGKQYARPGNIVTNAQPGQSIHNFGLAIDYVIVNEPGTVAIWTVDAKWKRVAAIGKSLGFQWGGDWTSFRDYPHLDMQRGMSLATLRSGKRPSIPGVPSRAYLGPGDTGTEVKLRQGQLAAAGYKTDIDGSYGPGMEASVRAYQKANGLGVDGLIGPITARRLDGGTVVKPPVNNEEVAQVTQTKRTEPLASHKENWERAKALGFLNGENPAGNVSREQMATIAVRIYDRVRQDIFGADRDVSASHAEAFRKAEDAGLLHGRPGAAISREQLATVLDRAGVIPDKADE